MLEKRQIQNFLRVNGIPANASDAEIARVLKTARWNDVDIQAALTTLRSNKPQQPRQEDTLGQMYRSNSKLSPETISSLLGIDVEVYRNDLMANRKSRPVPMGRFWKFLITALITLLITAVLLLAAMFSMETGPFHPTSTVFK